MKIGILGGTFDPVHLGHVGLAIDAADEIGLDKVYLMPASIQPFKQGRKTASAEDRIEMINIATKKDSRVTYSDYELNNEGISYTYLTLRAMSEMHPESELYFICGTDNVLKIQTWMKAEEILSNYNLVVGLRPGYKNEELDSKISELQRKYGTKIYKIHNKKIDVSSTEIRNMIANGCDLDDIIDSDVLKYIKDRGLYKQADDSNVYLKEKIEDDLREYLKESRRVHTYAVVRQAAQLARKFGCDVDKAEIAALLHDRARNMPVDMMNHHIKLLGLPKRYENNPNLAHSKIAAAMIPQWYGIEDEEIINAVSYHTTGRENMSTLEKVVFLADAIEPGRKYPTVDETRRLAEFDLDKACLNCLNNTIEYLNDRGFYIDEDTIKARDYLMKEEKR